MKRIVFLCAMKEEEQAIIEEFKNYQMKRVEENKTLFTVITVDNFEVIIGFCGCGKVNAGVSAAIAISSFNPDYIVNCGVGGGFSKEQNVLDVVVGTSYAYHDVDILCLGFKPGQLLEEPERFPGSEVLINAMKEIEKESSNLDFKIHYGLISSGDQFVHRDEQVKAILKDFPETVCVEMEGGAVAHACMKFNVPFIAIRSLSDIAVSDHNNSIDFLVACKAAAARAAFFAKKLVEKLEKL